MKNPYQPMDTEKLLDFIDGKLKYFVKDFEIMKWDDIPYEYKHICIATKYYNNIYVGVDKGSRFGGTVTGFKTYNEALEYIYKYTRYVFYTDYGTEDKAIEACFKYDFKIPKKNLKKYINSIKRRYEFDILMSNNHMNRTSNQLNDLLQKCTEHEKKWANKRQGSIINAKKK